MVEAGVWLVLIGLGVLALLTVLGIKAMSSVLSEPETVDEEVADAGDTD